ncbi:MAG TPA: hypothetical protein VNS81_06585 [Nocardioides sp.]|nr:hypothetical protein [Nocardioides sp.]
MSETTTAAAQNVAPSELFLSLTGFDEIAIAKAFGAEVSEIAEVDPQGQPKRQYTLLRALAFVHQRRQGLKDGDAFKAAMNLTLQDVTDYFADEDEDELDPDDPVGDQGKDDSPSS